MRFVSTLCKRVIYPSLAKSGYLRRLDERDAPAVLTYHGVLPPGYESIDRDFDGALVSLEALESQLAFLTRHYEVISPEQFRLWILGELELPPRSVLLTCDDGFLNQLTWMTPVLNSYRCICLFFVLGSGGGEMLWHEQLFLMLRAKGEEFYLDVPELSPPQWISTKRELHLVWRALMSRMSGVELFRRGQMMKQIQITLELPEDWDLSYRSDSALRQRFFTMEASELRKLHQGGMAVGGHSLSHGQLSTLPEENASEEIVNSRQRLSAVLGEPVWAFAYPFGDFKSVGVREMQLAAQAGYTCGFMNQEGAISSDADLRFALPRIHVTADMNLSEFEAHVSGFYRALRAWIPSGRGSNVMAHA